MNAPPLPDTLLRILVDKEVEVRTRSAATPLDEMERRARGAGKPRDFTGALCTAVAEGRIGLISEIKRASPSGGLIRDPFEPATIARAYEAAGASCLSVLTDAPYFQGAPEHLMEARAACGLPVLRKDFIIDPWQVFETRAMGGDCILLILAALSDAQANELEDVARTLDMSVLAEVHDERELERALGLNTRLIGINNRDLRTLRTDLSTTERLAQLVPADRIPVAESGLRDPEDVRRMARVGAHCILVGEHLLRQPDLTAAARAMVEA
ncbi:indole-3-glycerol phosphate synthase TrpC [Roseomonas marmotae]|uniref:Indole-3-glycerol phosphate synthase n=1 Tax=Roseomonas marmotae TaxID=2768161 RepID=A0ABS3KCM9_9PROT|nr:indole-3-glycerol phosphate synthase TrpC [Roseomonas marmotae]MBO1074388.1 indole-3-glycerol phosphate synthase TrpC [Roseomonas marmotae]QTI78130.1 indole-3-glycerol phosphate synthase TrpC [Roseomonas marmotae]